MQLPSDDDEGRPPPGPSEEDESLDPLVLAAAKALEPRSIPRRPALEPGTTIAGRYRLDDRLGEGGMGEVWAATHVITRRRVALKLLKHSAVQRADLRQRALREARAACAVQHPAVVEVLDVLEIEGGGPVLVMDLLAGETLGARLARLGALPVHEVLTLLLPVVEALEQAHKKGIIHRDLKPENIFLHRPQGGDVSVKVLDFGIAKLTATEGDAAGTGSLTGTGAVIGTPWYMAPEQVYGERDIDPRADIWALGVILYECLAGVRPVEGSSVGQVLKRILKEGIVPVERRVEAVPPELAALVGRMLAHDREGRPHDLAEVRRTLASLAGQPPGAVEASPTAAGEVHGEIARRPWRFALVVFAGVALLGATVAYSLRGLPRAGEDRAIHLSGAPAAEPVAGEASTAAASPTGPRADNSVLMNAPATSAAGLPIPRVPVRAPASPSSARRNEPPPPPVASASAVPSPSAFPPASVQPPPKSTEGRLYENVPF
jgi:serine/threonine-protein kinase